MPVYSKNLSQWQSAGWSAGVALTLILAGCATLHTHPLLGPVVAGSPAWPLLPAGQTYLDAQRRFSLTHPSADLRYAPWNSVGVVFNSTTMFVGSPAYLVFAFEAPKGPAPFALLMTAERVQVLLERQFIRLSVLREELSSYRGSPSMEWHIVLHDRRDRTVDHVGVGRLVHAGPTVYWMCVSRPVLDEPSVTDEHQRLAGQFFDEVKWLDPGSSSSISSSTRSAPPTRP